MDHHYCVDCATCGLIYGPFDSYDEARQHAASSGHAADATDKPTRPPNLVQPQRHGADGLLPPPTMTCGACGATRGISSRVELQAFEDEHEETWPDAVLEFSGALEDLPD